MAKKETELNKKKCGHCNGEISEIKNGNEIRCSVCKTVFDKDMNIIEEGVMAIVGLS